MTLTERLALYSAWRRGDEALSQPEPSQIGEDIDAAIARIDELEAKLRYNMIMLDGKVYDGQDIDKMLNRINILEEAQDDPPPDGYPSWEDWLAGEGVFVEKPHFGRADYGWCVYKKGRQVGDPFPTYPAALEAAKKEAGQ